MPLYYRAIGKERFRLNRLLNFAGTYIFSGAQSSPKFRKVCELGVEKMCKSYAILSMIICFSMSAVSIGPTIIFIRTGVWITPLGIQFPFADQSDIAFWLDLLIQLIIGVIGIPITVSIEMSSVIVNNAVTSAAYVIELSCDELSLQIDMDNEWTPQTNFHFRNLVLQVQDFDR